MDDKWNIKKMLESQEDVHEKVTNQSNLELSGSSRTRNTRPPRIQIDVQVAYDHRFGRSTYARKAKDMTFIMAVVSCPTNIVVICNHQNSTNY
jgi:hypothetical protein